MLKEIEDYNHYDCRSTRALRDWLLIRAWEAGVTPIGVQPVPKGAAIEDHDRLAAALAKFTGDAAVGARTPGQTAVAQVAAARALLALGREQEAVTRYAAARSMPGFTADPALEARAGAPARKPGEPPQ